MPNFADNLQRFLDAAEVAFLEYAKDQRSLNSVQQTFVSLGGARKINRTNGLRLQVCQDHLVSAVSSKCSQEPILSHLVETFFAIEPAIAWQRRGGENSDASDNFYDGHANGMIIGPGGVENRSDVWLGVSLLAPNVRYPIHTHPPEETYLVMSEGEFLQNAGPWFEPGIGGSFYNPPSILHSMRSGPVPLFAFWLLRPDRSHKK